MDLDGPDGGGHAQIVLHAALELLSLIASADVENLVVGAELAGDGAVVQEPIVHPDEWGRVGGRQALEPHLKKMKNPNAQVQAMEAAAAAAEAEAAADAVNFMQSKLAYLVYVPCLPPWASQA